jgi:hypothetical protein
MPLIVQAFLIVFEVAWFVAMLGLLWYGTVKQGKRLDRILSTQTDMIERAQHNNEISANAAHELAMYVRRMSIGNELGAVRGPTAREGHTSDAGPAQ